MKFSEPYHWYDLTTVHLPVIRQGYRWIHFKEVAKQMWALVLADLELLQAQNSEKNTQKYRLKDSKTNQSGGAVEKLRQTDTFPRHGHEICLSSGFTGFGKCMQLHSKFIYSHESHESTESNVFSCKSPTRCMVAVVQDLKSFKEKRVNVQHPSMWRGWVPSNATSPSWHHQKRPLISLVFVFFMTWVGNLRRQALSDIEYISSHHQTKIKTLQDTDLTAAIWFKRSVQAIPYNVTCPRETVHLFTLL